MKNFVVIRNNNILTIKSVCCSSFQKYMGKGAISSKIYKPCDVIDNNLIIISMLSFVKITFF